MNDDCKELILKIEELVDKLATLQQAKAYAAAAELFNSDLIPLIKQLELADKGMLAPYQNELRRFYDILLDGMSEAVHEHEAIRNELTGLRKKSAGINAYVNNSRRKLY